MLTLIADIVAALEQAGICSRATTKVHMLCSAIVVRAVIKKTKVNGRDAFVADYKPGLKKIIFFDNKQVVFVKTSEKKSPWQGDVSTPR